MAGALNYGVGVFFAVWLLLSILYQFDGLAVHLSKIDFLRILPRWTFFAPNPGQHDMHLVVRDRLTSGELTEWREVTLSEGSVAIPMLWNPEKRLAKMLCDCWSSIQFISANYDHQLVAVSGAYIMLLNVALRAPLAPSSDQRQFALLRSKGFTNRTIEPLFSSQFHLLSNIGD